MIRLTPVQKEAAQRLVNESYAHLSKTRKPSYFITDLGYKMCQYGGSGCAFAPAIKPEFRETIKQNMMASYFLTSEKYGHMIEDWAKPNKPTFARLLQGTHDDIILHPNYDPKVEFFPLWAGRLKELCIQHELDFPGAE